MSRLPATKLRSTIAGAALSALALGGFVLVQSPQNSRALAEPAVLGTPQSVSLPAVVRVTLIPGLMVGDVNLDARVTMADCLCVMRHRAGVQMLDLDQLRCADTNADGAVTMADALHIMQFRADPDGSAGILCKPLYDPSFHAAMIDPSAWPQAS